MGSVLHLHTPAGGWRMRRRRKLPPDRVGPVAFVAAVAFLIFALVLWMYILGAPIVGDLVQDLVQAVEKVHGG